MASHNVYTFFSVWNCLDEDFDAPDEGDREVCRAIVAGKAGMHPDGWDTRSGLTAVMPQGFNGYEWVPERYRRPIARSAAAIAEQRRENTEWEARHRRRPVEEPKRERKRPGPKPKPYWHWIAPADRVQPPAHGEVQLTCDDCPARFRVTLYYRDNRPAVVQSIRLLGKDEGWTCIAGTDRCPACSQPAAPKPVGNGAGGDQGHEQHR
jgi:hypothetical protein